MRAREYRGTPPARFYESIGRYLYAKAADAMQGREDNRSWQTLFRQVAEHYRPICVGLRRAFNISENVAHSQDYLQEARSATHNLWEDVETFDWQAEPLLTRTERGGALTVGETERALPNFFDKPKPLKLEHGTDIVVVNARLKNAFNNTAIR